MHLVFEFVDKNLLEVLSESYPTGLDPQVVRTCIWQIIRAIEYCHRHDVIHRDIKPENILVSLSDMSIKLCDFGFARSLPISLNAPLTDYVATRWYRAPELLLGYTNYGPAIDMFAIGCIMGEVVDGEPLLPGESEIDQLAIIHRVIGPLTIEHTDAFACNPRFVGMRIPTTPSSTASYCGLDRRFASKLSKRGLQLLRSFLTIEGSNRITAEQSLRHPYFDGIANQLPRQARPTTVAQPCSIFAVHGFPARNTGSRQSSSESVKSDGRSLRQVGYHTNIFAAQKQMCGLQSTLNLPGFNFAKTQLASSKPNPFSFSGMYLRAAGHSHK